MKCAIVKEEGGKLKFVPKLLAISGVSKNFKTLEQERDVPKLVDFFFVNCLQMLIFRGAITLLRSNAVRTIKKITQCCHFLCR